MEKCSVTCFVCALHEPKYNCPRCGVHYCSLECYRNEKHQVCSEGFYKEQVIEYSFIFREKSVFFSFLSPKLTN